MAPGDRSARAVAEWLDRVPPARLGSGRSVCCPLLLEHRGDNTRDGGDLLGAEARGDDAEVDVLAHSGMFPCFLGGSAARLVRSARNAFVTTTRVAAGSMTPSSSPRSAARNGEATS